MHVIMDEDFLDNRTNLFTTIAANFLVTHVHVDAMNLKQPLEYGEEEEGYLQTSDSLDS